MRRDLLHVITLAVICFFAFAFPAPCVLAQSQAQNGQIEGTVLDQNKGAVPNVVITVTNIGTGAARSVSTDEGGSFRFPLLPLGTYRISAEAASFKKAVREGITLATGQTAVVNLILEPGALTETVTVSADAPVADAGKIEQGRVMNSREVQNLPLITQNPYNFVFLQSNVTGNRTAVPGQGFANVNANGFSRRGTYQIDGSNATDVTMGGVRMLIISKSHIQEVQLLTNGMNAEFGATVGHTMNVVTPSGTNSLRGNVGYQFRRGGFAAKQFNAAPGSPSYQPYADISTVAIGGPVDKDRWHYYAGFEGYKWDLTSAARAITISAANRQALIAAGVPASAMPDSYAAPEIFRFFIGRTDMQLNSANRLGVRFLLTTGTAEQLGIGATPGNTLQLTTDNTHSHTSLAAQLISNKGSGVFNELRFQNSDRDVETKPNEYSGTGTATIRIVGIASFGLPPISSNRVDNSLASFQNNLSLLKGDHSIKIGGGLTVHGGSQRPVRHPEFRFQTIQNYLDALSGINPRGYSRYSDTFGDPETRTSALFWNGFVQDDWRASRRMKINAGLRYDLFTLPKADPAATYLPSQEFKVDKDNFGPRLGLVYALSEGDRPAVIRTSAGLYYDPPILNFYLSALQSNGNPRSFSYSLTPSTGGPDFPNRFSGQILSDPEIEAIDPNFKTMSALHANLQFEKALAVDLSFTAAYSHSSGRHIATTRETNCQPTGGTLADGRPLYGDFVVNPLNGNVIIQPCTNRLLPQFQNIWVWESVGNLNYDAATFSLTKRLSSGYQFSLNYTLARSMDDAPEENITATAIWQSDPSNRKHEQSVSISDQRHTFVGTFVGRPRFEFSNRLLNYVANNNQLSIIARASDGERQNLVTNADLNRDNSLIDRPVGIPRNFLKTPPYFNTDIRYSRNFDLSERHRLELFIDIINVTNTNSIVSFSNATLSANNINTSLVDPLTGELRGPLPDFRALGVVSTDSRRIQLGARLSF